MLNDLDRRILKILLKRETLITNKEIAQQCQISVNTLRKEIGLINEEIGPSGFYIESNSLTGCYIKVTDEEHANDAILRLQYLLERGEHIRKWDTSYISYLTRRCLSANGNLTIENLCEELYCSRSTLLRNLDEVKKTIGEFHLTLRNRRRYGISVEGNEWDFRQCLIYQHKMYKLSYENQKEYKDSAFKALFFMLENEDSYLEIRQILMDCLVSQEDFLLPVISFPKIVHYIELCASRAKYSGMIHFTEEQIARAVNTPEYEFVKRLYRKLPKMYRLYFKEADQLAVAMLILSYETKNYRLEEQEEYQRYFEETQEMISALAEQWGYSRDLFDPVFVKDWICFLYTLENQRLFGVYADTESQGIIWNKGIRTGDLCLCFARWYKEKKGVCLTHRDTISAFYLFRRVTRKETYCCYGQNILVISQYSSWVAESLAASIRTGYGKEVKSVTVREFGEKWTDDYQKFDLLVTDLGGARLQFFEHYKLPVLLVRYQLSETRFPELDAYLEAVKQEKELSVIKEESFHDTDLRSKEEVFQYLAGLYAEEMGQEELISQLRDNDTYLDLERNNGVVLLPLFGGSDRIRMEVLLNRTAFQWNSRPGQIFVCYRRNNSPEGHQILGEILKKFVYISVDTAHSMVSWKKGSPLSWLYPDT